MNYPTIISGLFVLIGLIIGFLSIILSYLIFYFFFAPPEVKLLDITNNRVTYIKANLSGYLVSLAVIIISFVVITSPNIFASNLNSQFSNNDFQASHKATFSVKKTYTIDVKSSSEILCKSNTPFIVYAYLAENNYPKTSYKVSVPIESDFVSIPKGKELLSQNSWIIKSMLSTPEKGISVHIEYKPSSPPVVYSIIPL